MGSGTHCAKYDGFPGTHGTHANGATARLDNLAKGELQDTTQAHLLFTVSVAVQLFDIFFTKLFSSSSFWS